MDKIYIVTAGDSFTDSHIKNVDTQNSISVYNVVRIFDDTYGLSQPNFMLKYQLFLIKELIDKGIEFEYYNVGKGSAGNHVITHNYIKKIQELLDSGINPKNIYGTIQLSGLVRPTNPLYDIEFDLPNVIGGEWDYLNHMSPDKNSYHDLLEAHIINIENIIEWNINNNIYNFKVFCGWDIFFEKELIQFNLNDRFNNINKDYFFRFEYKEKEDLIDFNCAGSKPILDKLFGIKPKYIVPAGKNGGMNEFVKEYCNENEYWYGAKNDPHLNTFGNWIWYIKFYRNLFESWGVLDSNNSIIKNEKIYNKLKKIFQINFDVFLDSYEFDFTKHEICIKKTAEYYKKYFI